MERVRVRGRVGDRFELGYLLLVRVVGVHYMRRGHVQSVDGFGIVHELRRRQTLGDRGGDQRCDLHGLRRREVLPDWSGDLHDALSEPRANAASYNSARFNAAIMADHWTRT